jgi:hypothetical protein
MLPDVSVGVLEAVIAGGHFTKVPDSAKEIGL